MEKMLKTKTARKSKARREPPEDVLTRALAAARDAIRDKNRALKMGQMDRDEMMEKNLAPVVGPLKQLVDLSVPHVYEPAPVVRTPLVPVKRKLADTAQHPDPQKRVKLSQSARVPKAVEHFRSSEEEDEEMDSDAYNRILNLAGASRIEESATPQRPIPGVLRGRLITDIGEPSGEKIYESPAKAPEPEQQFLVTPAAQEAALKSIDARMGKLTSEAFKTFLFKKDKMDLIYGVRYDNGQWKMGDKNVKISENDHMALIDPQDDERYMEFEATPGLINLIMYNEPRHDLWTQDDLKNYRKILEFTNVHRHKWGRKEGLKGNQGIKRTTVIKPVIDGRLGSESQDSVTEEVLVGGTEKKKKSPKGAAQEKKKKTGGGIPKAMLVTGNEIDYIPFRDPNQLVERLEKLVAEYDAGHTGHNNEIVAIAAALRRAEIIE